jgi:predicted phosphodiesterase
VSIFFFGDPHSDFRALNRAALKGAITAEDTVVLLGDYDLVEPLRDAIAPTVDTGCAIRWIIGNHDVDDTSAFDFLMSDSVHDLHGHVHVVKDGRSVAGLGGIHKGKIWRPTLADPNPEPRYPTRAGFLKTLRHFERWRGGLPLGQRDTIWLEDVEALGRRRADVLVCHEAPSTHEHGSPAIDALAKRMKARLIVHGHHHRSYSSVTGDGIAVRGLGIAELWRLPE